MTMYIYKYIYIHNIRLVIHGAWRKRYSFLWLWLAKECVIYLFLKQLKRLFVTNLIFLLLLFMFNIVNIGTNSLKKRRSVASI